MKKIVCVVVIALVAASTALWAQDGTTAATSTYQPKFAGDKAHSDAEAAALGYMRTLVAAQKVYKKKHNSYATSLMALVGSGSFTRRMAESKRGDYTVSFKTKGQGYSLALTPAQLDANHRAFYVDESGVFRAAENGPASAGSAELD